MNFDNLIKRQEAIKEPAPIKANYESSSDFGYEISSPANSNAQLPPTIPKNTNNSFDAFTNIFANTGSATKSSNVPAVVQKTEPKQHYDDFFGLDAAPPTTSAPKITTESASPLNSNNTSNIKIAFPAPVAMPKKVEPVNGGISFSEKDTVSTNKIIVQFGNVFNSFE